MLWGYTESLACNPILVSPLPETGLGEYRFAHAPLSGPYLLKG